VEDKVNLAAFCREFKAAAAKRGKNYLLTSACLCAVQQDTMQCKAAMQARLRAHAAQQVAPHVWQLRLSAHASVSACRVQWPPVRAPTAGKVGRADSQ